MLTGRGWIPAGEVCLGDRLVGSNGKWTRVLGVYPQGVVPLFRVAFSDGASLVTCGEHRWEVSQRYSRRPVVKTTAELAEDLHECDGRKKWRIPIVKPVSVFGTAKLPIDPYVLGAWLGDGHSSGGELTSADAEIVQAFAEAGFNPRPRATQNAGRATTYGLLGFKVLLRQLGLVNAKHIPDAYLHASAEQRLALLQGLCDTDGWVAKNGSQQAFCTTSPKLAAGFKQLLCSLGGVWTERVRTAAKKTAWEIFFRLPKGMAAFRLSRKQNRLTEYTPRHVPRRFVASVTPVEPGEAVCFTVDADDHLFCAGRDFVVTHNTLFTLIALLWLATFYPGLRHAYVTYNQTRAEEVSKDFKDLAARVGFDPYGTLEKMCLAGGTTLKFTSVKGGITGTPIDGVCVIDDPIKGAKEANSPTHRADAVRWWKMEARSRRHARTSYIAMATRWHVADLSGYLIKEQDFRYLNLKAIAEPANDNDIAPDGTVKSDPLHRRVGESLCPNRKPPEFFKDEQADRNTWYSMYQGEPQPLGGTVFTAPAFYLPKDLPTRGFKRVFGLDLNYTKKTASDFSAWVDVWAYRDPKLRDYKDANDKIGTPVIWFYIVEAIRKQVDAPSFTRTLKAKKAENAGVRFYWYAAGTEIGAADFIKKAGIPLTVRTPIGDKLVRANRNTTKLWNLGRVMLPRLEEDDESESTIEWVTVLAEEFASFTGVSDVHDDLVDAVVVAVDELLKQFNTEDGGGIDVIRTDR